MFASCSPPVSRTSFRLNRQKSAKLGSSSFSEYCEPEHLQSPHSGRICPSRNPDITIGHAGKPSAEVTRGNHHDSLHRLHSTLSRRAACIGSIANQVLISIMECRRSLGPPLSRSWRPMSRPSAKLGPESATRDTETILPILKPNRLSQRKSKSGCPCWRTSAAT